MTRPQRLVVERTVRERREDGTLSEAKQLSDFGTMRAWVLLGDPGAGKTKTFEALAALHGDKPITARDFVEMEPPSGGYPTPVFIDGLDEFSAGSGDGFTALGRIRSRLQALGTPAFRISCREADWRGSTDSAALQRLVGQGQFAELHLAPLNSEQVLQFAAYWLQSTEAEAQAFVIQAQRRDLEGLLTNPQTLRLLIEAVGADPGHWPDSKKKTYQLACAKLVCEQNEDHLAAQRDTSLTDTQLLDAAGYLSAVMLLAGCSAIAIQRGVEPKPHVVELPTLLANSKDMPTLNACRAALRTQLFAGDGTGNFTPAHRTVAEYLGARFLAERIGLHRLPANRVLALLQGEDGGVVPELRGLHAWLAVLANDSIRRDVIDHDPLGLVLHGDVLGFRTDEKIHLLQALQQEAKRYAHFRSQNWASRPFGALATPDMEAHFKGWLQAPDRTPAHQAVLDCVLDAMRHGQPMPALAGEVERVVGDKSYWSGLRRSALHVLCANAEHSDDWAVLLHLLEALRQGVIEDADNDLMGVVLHVLYPKAIPAKDLWAYYKPSSQTHLNQHWEFWRSLATRYAPREDIPALVDGLLASNIRLKPASDQHRLGAVIGALLLEAVTHFAEHSPVERVWNWLTLGMGLHSYNHLPHDVQEKLRQWFAAHPELYLQLVEHGISVLEKSARPAHMRFYAIYNLLCRTPQPSGTADRFMELAELRTDAFRPLLLREAFWLTERRDGADAAIERLSGWGQVHPEDMHWIHSELLSCRYPPDTQQLEWIDDEQRREKEKTQKGLEERTFLSEKLPLLAGNGVHYGLLDHIGVVYVDFFHHADAATPRERLLKVLHNNPHWVEMALTGLRYCLRTRDDIPSVPEILALHKKSRRFHIAVPLLAAMQLRQDEAPATALDLSDDLLQKLIAFRLTNNFGNAPEWFSKLVETRPDLVAAVMPPFIAQQIVGKAEHVDGLYQLAHDPHYAEIARRIAPQLAEALSVKVSKKQLRSVRELIACVLRTLDKPQQLALIANRLALPTMDVAQRVYWLTAGVQIAPDMYLPQLQRYLGTNQTRAAHAYAMLSEQRQERDSVVQLTLEASALFVELLGTHFTPSLEPPTGTAYWVSPGMETMHFVRQLISNVAADPSEPACAALSKLAQAPHLQAWRSQLQHAVYEQQQLRRKALFQHASVADVCHTLANLRPANVADLHALVLDQLTRLAGDIRNGNTNDFGQYWNGATPVIENDCRDRLLSDLKKQLPVGVAAEPEGNYADHKRADIKIISGEMHFPIEIKKNGHGELWKGIREQLIAKYSRERSSDGYGIYLVFWFGEEWNTHTIAGDGGNKPKSPQELQQRLAVTVPAELRHKIKVLVVDCAKPFSAKNASKTGF